jgi:hypothetical protein
MCKPLIVLGLVVLAMAFRCSRTACLRKLGAFVFLGASYCLVWFLTDSMVAGIGGIVMWFFLPWIELLTRIRRLRLPLNNRLKHRKLPDPSFFPNAIEAGQAIEEAGFEHVTNCGWEWAGMQQFFQLFWHPEEMAVAAVCLCEHSDVAFAFLSVTSYDQSGRTLRTTNYPFSTTLKCTPGVRWNHVACEKGCFHAILKDHQAFLSRIGVQQGDLRMPDPDELESNIEREMQAQLNHNLEAGIIRMTDDGYFQYSKRGLFFLWGQFVKDMFRLC